MKKFNSILLTYFHVQFNLLSIIYSCSLRNQSGLKILVNYTNSIFSGRERHVKEFQSIFTTYFFTQNQPQPGCQHRLRIILYIINQNYTQIFNIDLFEYLTIIYCNNIKLKSIWLRSSVFYIIQYLLNSPNHFTAT